MRNPILRADAAYALNPRDQRLRPLALDGDARGKPLRTVDPQALERSGGAEQDGDPAGHVQQGVPEVRGHTERRSGAPKERLIRCSRSRIASPRSPLAHPTQQASSLRVGTAAARATPDRSRSNTNTAPSFCSCTIT